MTHAYATVMTASPDLWLLLTISLPTTRVTACIRIWYAIKAIGCVTLHGGVYLLPAHTEHAAQLSELADETLQEDDQAWVLRVQAVDVAEDAAYRALFDRIPDYAEWLTELPKACRTLPDLPTAERSRLLRRYVCTYEVTRKTDFFSNETTMRANMQWCDLATVTEATHSPGGPRAATGGIPRRDPAQHQDRLRTTRRHLWVDRVTSAWLIQYFIDPHARLLWLDGPADYPAEALGFDFGDTTSTHVGECVSFEVLIASFGSDDGPGLARLGATAHTLDVGGMTMPEASGFETILTGVHKRLADDGALLAEVGTMLNLLYVHFSGSRRT